MNDGDVTAVLVTRGDVDLAPILAGLPYGNAVVWNNATRPYDAGVFGRYLALAEVKTPYVFFQDDDCLVPPAALAMLADAWEPGHVVGNMMDSDPQRLKLYHDTTLLGWGALFERELPWRAFHRYALLHPLSDGWMRGLGAELTFPMLTPSKTVIGGIEWLAEHGEPVFRRDNRMWRQPGFYADLDRTIGRVRAVRDQLASTGR